MKSIIIKALLKLGLTILFLNSFYKTYIDLARLLSGEAAGGFLIGIVFMGIFSISFYGIGYVYDWIKEWVCEYQVSLKMKSGGLK